MATITDQLRALRNGWRDPIEVLAVTDKAADRIADLLAALRGLLEQYSGFEGDGLKFGFNAVVARDVEKARAAISRAEDES